MVSYRWMFALTEPAPSSQVVPVAQVREQRSRDTPAFDQTARVSRPTVDPQSV